jgi:tellurite resistance protein TehA-like permease
MKEIQKLPPSCFALVMSTGIVSIAAEVLNYHLVGKFLFYLNNLQFFLLIVLFFTRLLLFFPDVLADLSDHSKGAGFLTITAASGILGMQYAIFKHSFTFAAGCWLFAFFSWLVFLYSFFILAIIKKEKPSLESGLNGSVLLLVVSTQSLSVLATTLGEHLPFPPEITQLFAFGTFLLGFLFYIIIITLTFQRLLFSPFKPGDFKPPDWIDMGAAAITALAGATLLQKAGNSAAFGDLYSFVKATSLLCWTMASWWIPVIFFLEARRHVQQEGSFKYETGYWSAVFPLGMYTVCTGRLSEALPFPSLHSLSAWFVFIAFAAWVILFIGMCVHLVGKAGKPASKDG